MHIFKSCIIYSSLWFSADSVKINLAEKLFCIRLKVGFFGKQDALLDFQISNEDQWVLQSLSLCTTAGAYALFLQKSVNSNFSWNTLYLPFSNKPNYFKGMQKWLNSANLFFCWIVCLYNGGWSTDSLLLPQSTGIKILGG